MSAACRNLFHNCFANFSAEFLRVSPDEKDFMVRLHDATGKFMGKMLKSDANVRAIEDGMHLSKMLATDNQG